MGTRRRWRPGVALAQSEIVNLMQSTIEPGPSDAVLGIDVGSANVRVAAVGTGTVVVDTLPTASAGVEWNIERLCTLAADLHERAVAEGLTPLNLTVNANGQVDEFHGAVQHSPNLAWHDVAVKDRVGAVVPCEVVVRHSVRAAALAESNLGVARGDGGVLFVSLGTGIIAAGSSAGVVVADHVGAGDIAGIRIRSGPGEGRTLEEVASAPAIAHRYAELRGVDPGAVTAADVHAALAEDPVARAVWDSAMDALADALEWSTMLFGPETLVLGGGMAAAGADLVDPVDAGIRRRFGDRAAPAVRLAAFGPYSGLVGAVLTGWKKARFGIDGLDHVVDPFRVPTVDAVADG